MLGIMIHIISIKYVAVNKYCTLGIRTIILFNFKSLFELKAGKVGPHGPNMPCIRYISCKLNSIQKKYHNET